MNTESKKLLTSLLNSRERLASGTTTSTSTTTRSSGMRAQPQASFTSKARSFPTTSSRVYRDVLWVGNAQVTCL